jgi:hypothetical protein
MLLVLAGLSLLVWGIAFSSGMQFAGQNVHPFLGLAIVLLVAHFGFQRCEPESQEGRCEGRYLRRRSTLLKRNGRNRPAA